MAEKHRQGHNDQETTHIHSPSLMLQVISFCIDFEFAKETMHELKTRTPLHIRPYCVVRYLFSA